MFTQKSILRMFSILLVFMTLFVPTNARAASLTVNSLTDTIADDGDCTLREAIENANKNTAKNPDCAAGSGADTITFSVSGTITLTSTLPVINDAAGLIIDGTGQDVTISGNNAVRVIYAGDTLTLNHLTIANGYSTGGYAGGGIYHCCDGTLTILNSTFSSNKVDWEGTGGGIYNYFGTLTIANSTFIGNNVTDSGGAIYNNSAILVIMNSTFINNTADGASWGSGGGGIYNTGDDTSTITNSTFSGNSADWGKGDSIYNYSGALTITNSTFAGNSADSGGDISNLSDTLILRNTVIANSTYGGNCDGTITVDSYNLATDNTCGGATQKTSAEINLGPLADNGGSTQTVALLTGSAAIDAGNNAVCPATDQRGTARPQGNACDVGAFESSESAGMPIFADVPVSHWAYSYIERLYNAGITGGCSTSPLTYCPDATVTRAQMAIFILRGMHGSAYVPPAATGTVFADVPLGSFAADWIEQLALESVTSGCGNGNYCPDATVTRAQMSIFLLRGEHGSTYTPPAATGTVFSDVPPGSFAADWIEQLALEAITSGCGGGNYCPDSPVTRAEMAVFLVRAFSLP